MFKIFLWKQNKNYKIVLKQFCWLHRKLIAIGTFRIIVSCYYYRGSVRWLVNSYIVYRWSSVMILNYSNVTIVVDIYVYSFWSMTIAVIWNIRICRILIFLRYGSPNWPKSYWWCWVIFELLFIDDGCGRIAAQLNKNKESEYVTVNNVCSLFLDIH